MKLDVRNQRGLPQEQQDQTTYLLLIHQFLHRLSEVPLEIILGYWLNGNSRHVQHDPCKFAIGARMRLGGTGPYPQMAYTTAERHSEEANAAGRGYRTTYGGENSVTLDRIDFERTAEDNSQRGIKVKLNPEGVHATASSGGAQTVQSELQVKNYR